MKVELIEAKNGAESCEVTTDDGKKTVYHLSSNEGLLVGLIIGLQDEVTELTKKIQEHRIDTTKTEEKLGDVIPCKRCGSERHTTEEKSCCNCAAFISQHQKCKKKVETTRNSLCSMWEKKE